MGILILVIYLGICVYLYTNQDDLLFHPKPKSFTEIKEVLKQQSNFDTLCYIMKDGTKINGFISKDSANVKLPTVIYYGGNAEEVSHVMEKKNYFTKFKLALFNYRGYGLSEGKISQANMFSDAIEIIDKLKTRTDVDTGNINILGRSIGTGVATYASSKRKVHSTVLITPYGSMIDVAQEKYPIIPIGLLIKHPFNSNSYAVNINSKMLSLIAHNDQVIPTKHAFDLLKHWKGKTEYLEVNEDHSSIMQNNEAWTKIERFMSDKD